MKPVFIFLITILFVSCSQPKGNSENQQAVIDSIELKLANAYKPGLGEFMSAIQVHHAKLWFAGQGQNWQLADFEIKEIMEAIDDIKNYNTDRPEVKSISLILPAIDSVSNAIQQKNPALFKRSFAVLTNTCNDCHNATHHEFIIIKVPDTPPFTNQEFKVIQ